MHPSDNKPAKIRVMLVDDHILMRMGLNTALNNEPDLQVVAEAEDGQEAVEAYATHRPDVVVLDLRMPKLNGFETIEVLRRVHPSARVLILSNYSGGDDVANAFKAGAHGYVSKGMPLEKLLEAIRAVARGDQYVPPEIARRHSSRVASQLSPREMDVLTLIAKGQSNKEIAATLNLVEGTVKIHVTNVLSKLGVADRTQAVLAAMRRGILQLE